MSTRRAQTAKTGGSTPKPAAPDPKTTKSPTTTHGAGGGWTRTTSAYRGGKTVRICYNQDMVEIACPKRKQIGGKMAGIIIGAIAGTILLVAIALVLRKKWKARKAREANRGVQGGEEGGENVVVESKVDDKVSALTSGWTYIDKAKGRRLMAERLDVE